jgi:hypothetical protein
MSVQPPPTNTTTPVYNPIFYVNPTASSGIDVAFLDANYLKFPTAQGSEDFTNGLFSTDTIDFNSATGANRAITNVSKTEFSDIVGNNLYTAYIEENSTAIGIYDGGLIINSSNSINLVATDILANGAPLGGGNVSNNQSNTFQNGFTQTFDGVISIDNTQSNIGQLALGLNNTAIGFDALLSLTTGEDNTAYGNQALQDLTTGDNNTALGNNCLSSIISGTSNTAVGYACLSTSTIDINNTALGFWSGLNLDGNGTDSNYNTFIGYEAGINQLTGSYNVALGYQTGASSSFQNLSNTIAIGNGVTSVATGDMILGFTNFTPPNDYWVKFTPNTTFGGVQLQGLYNANQNFTIETNGGSVALDGTFVDLNGTGSGVIGGVNVSNGMNINSGVIQSIGQASNPTFQSLYSCFYSLSGVPYFGYNNAGTYTYQQLATSVAPTTFSYTSTLGSIVNTPPIGAFWRFNIPIQTATSPYSSPPWGKTFRWSIYPDIDSPIYGVNNAEIAIQGLFILITGTGVYQPVNSNFIDAYGYVFSNIINSVSASSGSLASLSLTNKIVNAVNQIQIVTPSTDPSISSFSLKLVIETIQ